MPRSPAPLPQAAISEEVALTRIPTQLHHLTRDISSRRVARMVEVLDRRMGSLVLVVEAVRRRHNVSAILRTADALGLHQVHLVTGQFRPSAGAARGSERWIDIQRHATTTACITELRDRGFRCYAADLHPDALTPEQVPVEGPVALLFGSELSGVSDEARALVDGYVILPMLGFVESVNVSVAAALITRAVADRRRAIAGADLSEAAKHQALTTWLERESMYKVGAEIRSGKA
jgi:tRNA (guanosine-2'-O-)-methyltransferase